MRNREEMSDPLEEQLMNESSPLCNEIELRRNKTKEEGERELPRTNSVKETITEVSIPSRISQCSPKRRRKRRPMMKPWIWRACWNPTERIWTVLPWNGAEL